MGGRQVAHRRDPLLSRPSLLLGLAVALGAGVALVVSACTVGHADMFRSDGAAFAAIARDPFGNASTLHSIGWHIDGTAYRFGRVLVPFLAWVLAAGRPAATNVTLPIVVACGYGLSVAAAAELCRRRGRAVALGLVVVCVPYTIFWLRTPHLVADPVVTGLVLLTYLLRTTDHRRASYVLAACTVLAREAAVVAFLPLAWRDVRERGRAAARTWLLTLAPYALWCAWLRFRTGTVPMLDPASSRRTALGLPLVGLARVLGRGLPAAPMLTFLALGATVLVAQRVARRAAWFPVRDGALCLTALVLCYGPGVWRMWGEALRVMSTTQACLLLALVAGLRDPRDREAPGASAASSGSAPSGAIRRPTRTGTA